MSNVYISINKRRTFKLIKFSLFKTQSYSLSDISGRGAMLLLNPTSELEQTHPVRSWGDSKPIIVF